MNIYSVIKKPLVTEKTSLGTGSNNTVAIVVDKSANKIEIKQAIEYLFKVKVAVVLLNILAVVLLLVLNLKSII